MTPFVDQTARRVDLTWFDNSLDEDQFLMEKREDGPGTTWEHAGVAPKDSTVGYTATPLGKAYWFRVRAYRWRLTAYSEYSNEVRCEPPCPSGP